MPQYYHIQMGHGGLLELYANSSDNSDDSKETIRAVGTTECYSCVGVYVPISDTKCFAAHIRAERKVTQQDIEDDADAMRVLCDQEGEDLITFVKQHFCDIVGADLATCQNNKDEVILVCLNPKAEDGRKMVGYYIIRALCELLGCTYVDDKSAGFIVDKAKGICQNLPDDEYDGGFVMREKFNLAAAGESPASVKRPGCELHYNGGQWFTMPVMNDREASA